MSTCAATPEPNRRLPERHDRAVAARPSRLADGSGCSRMGAPAYSLVELVLVLSIMGVVAAIAAPRYASALARYRADAAARRIASDITQARAVARASGASTTLAFKPALSEYEVGGVPRPDRRAGAYIVRLGENPYEARIHSASLGGDATLTFDSYGVPDSGGSVTVRVGRFGRTVAVHAVTGEPTIGELTHTASP